MNINQFSDIPLISSQQFELNDNQLSILDDDFFQKLLQLTEKQQWLSDNNNHVNATNLKDNELEQKERMESEELFILFSMPLNQQEDIQQNRQSDAQPKNKPIYETKLLLEANPTMIDPKLDTQCTDDIKQRINIDEKAAEVIASINYSQQLINKTNKPNPSHLLAWENNQPQTTKNAHLSINQTQSTDKLINNHSNDHQTDLASTLTDKLFTTNLTNTPSEMALSIDLNSQSSLFNPPTSTANPTTLNLNLPMPMDISKWQASLNEQICLISRQGIQNAEIKLNPQELGSLHIKLAMIDDKIDLHMAVAHNMVKGVLESALPMLKTSLEQQGITLQHTNISDFSMMNDSKQSSSYQQPQQFETEQQLDDINPIQQKIDHHTEVVQSGLSIFA
ncbi:flagellar hook-length control protein FliK [Gilliamella apis]|uniref:flagellar hook-length control protein FliK n=1 Tax=Gilliamella apis TaxID=1970738 RepID=UPI0027404BE7|nr:flagellar hook-length control protein FliK [Gilliamella apis]WLT06791.1 flagellar hook-length control protein FliK [Gilliamella apis]